MLKVYDAGKFGFTLVELLIVIVVIGIIASITLVSYNGTQGKANDVAVQSDLQNMGGQLDINNATTHTYPSDELALSLIGFKVSKGSYGNHLVDGGTGYKYNALYCSTVSSYSPADFAIIASSSSGNVFSYHGGKVAPYPSSSWSGGWGNMCPALLGVATGNSATGIWLYENSIWKIWLNS